MGLAVTGWLALRGDPTLVTYDFGEDPGPALVPRLLLAALGAGGGLLLLQGLRRLRAGRHPARTGPAGVMDRPSPPGRPLVPVLFVASLAVYLPLLPRAGFRAVTLVFSVTWMLLLTRLDRGRLVPRDWALAAGAGLALTGALYYVFHGFVRVPLP